MNLRESYEQSYGEDLKWENLENFMQKLVRDQQEKIADKYVESTTLNSGKFVGDRRVVELIATSPLR